MLNIITASGLPLPPPPPPLGLASTATIPLEAWQLDFTAEKEESVFTFTIQTDAIAQYTDDHAVNYEKYCQITKKVTL